MDPINIPQMLAYIPYMDAMGDGEFTSRGLLHILPTSNSGIFSPDSNVLPVTNQIQIMYLTQ